MQQSAEKSQAPPQIQRRVQGLNRPLKRRAFLKTSAWVAGGIVHLSSLAAITTRHPRTETPTRLAAGLRISDLPKGAAPTPVPFPHFPDRLCAFVWRNWQLVPAGRLGQVVGTSAKEIIRVGRALGLAGPPRISADQQRRSYLTVIKRNWHLLPYEQLLALLDWTPAEMAFALREDDFLFIKLGNLKPQCEPLRFTPSDAKTLEQARRIAKVIREEFPDGVGRMEEPLFDFVSQLSTKPSPSRFTFHESRPKFSPRFCYSYFALYGDPLLEPAADPFPDGYLARLAASGVDGVWLQGVLSKLAPFPWNETLSARYRERLANLRSLAARARRHGIGIYLYLNEPRALPLVFYDAHPELMGVTEGDHATLCTSHAEVRNYLVDSVATICRAVPDLAGVFTITASENLTNCWSHGAGGKCPRCGQRTAAEVIAEVNRLFREGIRRASSQTRLIAWDWGWADAWAADAIRKLPDDATLMSVSEWSIPIQRGGIDSVVGEYSISTIGPGPRAQRHWALARQRGLRTIAKIQAGNTWELSAVPYIPALENVARHALNLRKAQVDGIMLGWTLGGYPSPNLEVVAELAGENARAERRGGETEIQTEPKLDEHQRGSAAFRPLQRRLDQTTSKRAEARAPFGNLPVYGHDARPPKSVLSAEPSGRADRPAGHEEQAQEEQAALEGALERVARRRFGEILAPDVVQAWREFSAAFGEFPYHGGLVYSAPMQLGPANPLWAEPTGYRATMVGFPYDDLDSWRAVYPTDVFISQFKKIAAGFDQAIVKLRGSIRGSEKKMRAEHRRALAAELSVAEAAAIHFHSTANQARFVQARRGLAAAKTAEDAKPRIETLAQTLADEIVLAKRLCAIQTRDSRIGFEASNQYYYVPVDLAEKVLNCRDLLEHWLPAQRALWKL